MALSALAAALALGGGSLLSGLGNSITSSQGYSDQTQSWLDQFNKANGYSSTNRDLNANRSNAFYNMLSGGSGSSMGANNWYSKAADQGTSNQAMLSDYYSKLNGSYSPSSLLAQYQSSMDPSVRAMATQAATDATSRSGQSMMDLAQSQSTDAVRSMQNSMSQGGLFGTTSGAVSASLMRGASEPLMQAQNQINSLYSNAYQNAYSPMMQSSLSSQYSLPSQMLSGINAGQQQQQLYQSGAQGLGSMLADQSQQSILAPSLKQNTSFLGSLLSGLGNLGKTAGSYGLGLLGNNG